MRSTRRWPALLALLVVAACSGSGEATPSSPTPVPSLPALPTPATTSEATTPPSPTPAATPDAQGLLDQRRAAYGAPGAVAVLRRGDQRWFAGSGAADLDGTTITETTRFRIASITKPIVATLVLDAVDRGSLSLDAVVGDLLPGVVRAQPPVTVRQLLDHTSGIFDESNAITSQADVETDIGRLKDRTLKKEARDVLRRYLAGTPVIASDHLIVGLSETHDRYFAPGAGYHYSNTNYQLAAMILEAVTGQPLDALLRTRIADPLGLTLTSIAPPDLGSPELRGYGTGTADESLVDLTDDLVLFGNGGNGGIISTADELLTTMQAIVSGRLLPDELVTEMKKPNRQSYGLGLATYNLSCGTFYGHEGGVNGTASIAIVSPDGSDGVVIAFNLRSDTDPGLPALADAMLCGGG